MPEGKVVVTTPAKVYKHTSREAVAIRLEEMGLTAYGASEDEAWEAFKQLFSVAISYYRAEGRLAKELKEAGVTWHWVENFDGAYDDVADLADDDHHGEHGEWVLHAANDRRTVAA